MNSFELSTIKSTIQRVAEAITAALDIETEIVDNSLMILGGTGSYKSKIGSFEEDGNLDSNDLYATLLRTGEIYFTIDPKSDPMYNAMEGELAEICCPIKHKDQILGLIGLVALTDEQRNHIINKSDELTNFLNIMASLIVDRIIANEELQNSEESLKSFLMSTPFTDLDDPMDIIIGNSDQMQMLKQRAIQVSTSDSTILITGDSGTGKEVFARAIHNSSNRSNQPFIAINCGAIPEMLLESELFGYEKGSFSGANAQGKIGKFQLADKGTIFLDEIGDMPLHMQVKLLRAIQNKQIDRIGGTKPIDIDLRIIAATNQNLEQMVREKKFRQDLYFRLNVIPLHIPPLRERIEDIRPIADYTFNKFKEIHNNRIDYISNDAYEALESYNWPGNVRELENAIEFAINVASGNCIESADLPDKITSKTAVSRSKPQHVIKKNEWQRDIIIDKLNQYGWDLDSKRKVAEELGISQATLYRRLKKER